MGQRKNELVEFYLPGLFDVQFRMYLLYVFERDFFVRK